MYWSVHQYHRPMMGEASITPSHGVSLGSNRKPGKPIVCGVVDSGRQRWMVSGLAARSPSRPPTSARPRTRMMSEPISINGVCMPSVHSTAFMPPVTV